MFYQSVDGFRQPPSRIVQVVGKLSYSRTSLARERRQESRLALTRRLHFLIEFKVRPFLSLITFWRLIMIRCCESPTWENALPELSSRKSRGQQAGREQKRQVR
jgi:hypothetical protein